MSDLVKQSVVIATVYSLPLLNNEIHSQFKVAGINKPKFPYFSDQISPGTERYHAIGVWQADIKLLSTSLQEILNFAKKGCILVFVKNTIKRFSRKMKVYVCLSKDFSTSHGWFQI